jgi:F-type H+-transporting ATPase subunit gamma
MTSLREIRRKIKSVQSTKQITNAMKMVATARLKKAQSRILAARPYALDMGELLADLSTQKNDSSECLHPFFCAPHAPPRAGNTPVKHILVVVTSDKGLCGAFNTNILRKTLESLALFSPAQCDCIAVGRKARDFLRRIKQPLIEEYAGFFSQVRFIHADMIGDKIMELFKTGCYADVRIYYNTFKSMMRQEVTEEILIPIQPQKTFGVVRDYLYEQTVREIIDSLAPRYVNAEIYRILLESNAAEYSARMASMDSATKNAQDMMSYLTLMLNRNRQSTITKELAELVGGAEALR